MPLEQILHEGYAVALFRPCHNDHGTGSVLPESRLDGFEVVSIHLEGGQSKCSELIGKRLKIGNFACLSKPLKAVQVHDDCEIQAMMTTEYQRLPIGPLVPFAV